MLALSIFFTLPAIICLLKSTTPFFMILSHQLIGGQLLSTCQGQVLLCCAYGMTMKQTAERAGEKNSYQPLSYPFHGIHLVYCLGMTTVSYLIAFLSYRSLLLLGFVTLAFIQPGMGQIRAFGISIKGSKTVQRNNLVQAGGGNQFEAGRTPIRPGLSVSYSYLPNRVGFRTGIDVTLGRLHIEQQTTLANGRTATISQSPFYRNVGIPATLLFSLNRVPGYVPSKWQCVLSAGTQISWLTETGFRSGAILSGNGTVIASFNLPDQFFRTSLHSGVSAGIHLFRQPHRRRFYEISLNWLCVPNGAQDWQSKLTVNNQVYTVKTNTRALHWVNLAIVYNISKRRNPSAPTGLK
jgi:hypothetical protein